MKFSKLSQLFLVSSLGLLVAVLLTACQIVTIDYVFVADSAGTSSGSAGQIQIFAVDSESGALRTGATTVASGGVGPIAMALTSDYANLYVANQTSKNVAHFAIASDGSLTLKDTLALSPRGEIEVDARGATSVPGVFAAGDVTTAPYKQIIISMGDGATAALSAFDYLIRLPAESKVLEAV